MEINNAAGRWLIGADPKTGVYNGQEDNHQKAQAYKQEIKQLRDAVKSDPDMSSAEKKAALKQLDYMEKNALSALDFTTTGSAYNVNAKDKYDNNNAVIDECFDRLEYAMKEFNKMAPHIGATAVSPPEKKELVPFIQTATIDVQYGGSSVQNNSVADAGSSKGSQRDKLMDLMRTDPDKFMAEMEKLGPEKSGSMMMLINQKLQESNQMFSMMSNMSKAEHDTAKAIISNMRV